MKKFYVVYLNGDNVGIFSNKKSALQFADYLDFYDLQDSQILVRGEYIDIRSRK